MKASLWSRKLFLLCCMSAAAMATLLSACVLPDYAAFLKTSEGQTSDQRMITVSADPIILQWDPPATPISKYAVYYRAHGTLSWTALGEVPADPQPSYSVSHAVVGSGEFDFGVVAIDAAGDQSPFHTSLDSTASPATGWYVLWE